MLEAVGSRGAALPASWGFTSNLAAPGDLRFLAFDQGTGAAFNGVVFEAQFLTSVPGQFAVTADVDIQDDTAIVIPGEVIVTMPFTLSLDFTIPGTPSGPVATTLANAIQKLLGDESGLTGAAAAHESVVRFWTGLYRRELQAVDAAAANATDRATIDQLRDDIETLLAAIKVREEAFKAQADTDMGNI